MKALLFDYKIWRLALARIIGSFCLRGYLTKFGPLRLKDLSKPKIKNNDWVVVKTLKLKS